MTKETLEKAEELNSHITYLERVESELKQESSYLKAVKGSWSGYSIRLTQDRHEKLIKYALRMIRQELREYRAELKNL